MGNIRSLWDSSGSCLRTLARMRNTSFSGLVPQSLSVPLFLWVYSSLEESVYCCLGHTLERIASGSPNKQTTKTRRGDGTRGVTESATTACNSCSRSSTDSQSIRYDAIHSSWKAILQSKYQTETDSPGCVATRSTASVFLFATATSSRQLPPKRSCSDSTRFVSFRFDSFRLVSFRIVSSSSRISPLVLTHCDKFNSLSRRLLLLPCRALYLPLTLSLTRTEEQEKKITTKARRALRLVLVLVSISISYRLEIASKSLACAAQKCVVTWQTVGRKLIAFGLGFGFCFQRQQRRERADAARQHFVAPATFS